MTLRTMRKYVVYSLDGFLLLSAIAALASSYLLWFILPRGLGNHGGITHGLGKAGNSQDVMGLVRYNWIEIHNWASVVFLAVVLIHIILHWNWIIKTTKRIRGHLHRSVSKVLEVYGSVVVLFVLFIFDCLSGFVIWLALPRGAGDYNSMKLGYGRTFLGLQRNVWVDLHAWVAVLIVAIIIVHLILNWNWVVGVTKKIFWGITSPLK